MEEVRLCRAYAWGVLRAAWQQAASWAGRGAGRMTAAQVQGRRHKRVPWGEVEAERRACCLMETYRHDHGL